MAWMDSNCIKRLDSWTFLLVVSWLYTLDFAQYLPLGDTPLYCIAPTGSLALLGHTMY